MGIKITYLELLRNIDFLFSIAFVLKSKLFKRYVMNSCAPQAPKKNTEITHKKVQLSNLIMKKLIPKPNSSIIKEKFSNSSIFKYT